MTTDLPVPIGLQAQVDQVVAAMDEPDDGKEPCPHCGNRYVPGPGMGVHIHAAHPGVVTRRSKHVRAAARKEGGTPGPGRPPKIDITVEDIFDAVVAQMFPKGYIPTASLAPLLRWRHATDEMLIEVRNGNGK